MLLVGVCGGIAAYKSCELVRLLVRAGHDVQVIQTAAATRFVGPVTFAGLSRRPVLTDGDDAVFPHLDASRDAELLCIAPLTANHLARLAHGTADTLLAQTALAFRGPLVVAPAMNVRMWQALATQANIALLAARGAEVIGPAVGELAEGEVGAGRMSEPDEIAAAITRRLDAAGALRGTRVLVTAGGTREPIDAVRYVGNRSSGRMGVALAEEAAARGADVTLVLAAAAVEPPAALPTVRVESADELRAATHAAAERADVVVMAAAVADYRPAEPLAGKRAKDGRPWTLALEPTADVLAELGARRRPGQVLVGFAAEHGAGGEERAGAKLARKGVDMIVLNDVSRPGVGFDAADNELTLITADGAIAVGRRSKRACAAAVWDAVAALPAAARPEPTRRNRSASSTV
jgi:phosphopantothenoylcysteine decarboxylase/phosphopantothenate--cysteine ligase